MIPVGKVHANVEPPSVLSNADVCKQFADISELVPLLENALADFSASASCNGSTTSVESTLVNPVRTTIVPYPGAFFMTMPVFYQRAGVFTCKLVSSVTPRSNGLVGNNAVGPVLNAVLALFDCNNGQPLAFMEAEELTGFRTAVVTYLSAKHLLPCQPNKVAIVGIGTQAASHVQVLACLLKPKVITVWGRDFGRCVEFCERWKSVCAKQSTQLEPAKSIVVACDSAEFIVTTTSSSTPVLPRDAVGKNCKLVSIVGAPTRHAQEVDPKIMQDCRAIYADSRAAASTESGDVINSGREIYTELGEIISGSKKRVDAEEASNGFVVFKSQGLAVEDAVTARYVFDRYKQSH